MTEEDARLELLKIELNAVQAAIRSLDTIVFQIKGWCVTVLLAISGFAITNHKPALVLVGMGAAVGFFLVNCQFKMIQRAFIQRNQALDSELRTVGIAQVLKGAGTLEIVGTALPKFRQPGISYSKHALYGLWNEARLANTFSLYAFLLACLAAEAIILFL